MKHPRDLEPSDDPDRDGVPLPTPSPPADSRPSRSTRRLLAAVAAAAIAAGGWALMPSSRHGRSPEQPQSVTVTPAAAATTATRTAESGASTGAAPSVTGPPRVSSAAAVDVGRRFVAAWTLPAATKRRTAALQPVATPRLVHTLAPLARDALPKIGGPVTVRTTAPTRVVLTVPVTNIGTAVLVALSDGQRWRIAAVGLERL